MPSNILHLDILALEYRLLRRAQEQGIPGTPDRHHPLPSLGALLQVLQIPVPPYAPLGNAGNDAFFTVLAFQKLMMAETHLPDVLFQPSLDPPPSIPFVRPTYSRGSSSSPRSSRRMSMGDPTIIPDSRGNAPTSLRHESRAQTVFWDDSQYSTPPKPPADTRPKLPSSQSSRSVSWVADASVEPSQTETKPKLKSEKSVKNLAGTLARFWVG